MLLSKTEIPIPPKHLVKDIFKAVYEDDSQEVEELIYHWKNHKILNHINKKKQSALWIASRYGYEECVAVLLEYGVNVNLQSIFGETAA
jgi:hypothetical protein